MNDHRITWLVVNPASGSNDEAAVAAVQQALIEVRRGPQRIVRVPDEPAPGKDELEQGGVELLVLFTGDGTANRAVTGLYGWSGDVLVLPGGTQNLLAGSLHGEDQAPEIVARLGRGGLMRVRRPLLRCSAAARPVTTAQRSHRCRGTASKACGRTAHRAHVRSRPNARRRSTSAMDPRAPARRSSSASVSPASRAVRGQISPPAAAIR